LSARRRAAPGWLALALCLGLAGGLAGCAASSTRDPAPRYRPDRRDYATFRAAWPDVLIEPNYLPFMLHQLPGGDARGDLLVFCRWPDERMPLRVWIDAPPIPERLQDEFVPRDVADYARAVERALAQWEAELEGLVRFRVVDVSHRADLRLRLRLEEARAPEPEIRVLGATPAILDGCRPSGWEPDASQLRVAFDVPEVELYVADDFGLLTPGQVERVALHEIGHALGMKGHSPFADNVMYRAVRDRAGRPRLQPEDVHSFVSLYRLPNGTHFGWAPDGAPPPPPPPGPPAGPPLLEPSPHVDSRLGFQLRVPAGWLRLVTAHGVLAANGPMWDHDAALLVMVRPEPTLEAFLARYQEPLLAGSWLRSRRDVVVLGRRGLRLQVEDARGERAQDFWLVETGDGRVLLFLAEAPVADAGAWAPWFEASLATLRIW